MLTYNQTLKKIEEITTELAELKVKTDFYTHTEYVEKLKENDTVCNMITLKGAKHAFVLFDYQSSDEQAEGYMEKTMEFIKNNLF